MAFCRREGPRRQVPHNRGVRSRRIRIFVLALLPLALAALGAALAQQAATTSDPEALRQQLQTINRKKSRVQRKLAAVKSRQRQIARELKRINSRIARTESQLRTVTEELERARLELDRAKLRSQASQLQLEEYRTLVADRLVAIYQQGDTTSVEAFLSSTSFTDFANRLYLLDQVVSKDGELLEEFEAAYAEAEQRRAEVAEKERALAALRESIRKKRDGAASERERKDREKRNLERDRAVWERALAELERNSREVTTLLRRMERTPEGRKRLATPWKGKLRKPVNGRITSKFGYRIHPIYKVRKMHTGVDIAASRGTPIHAAAGGVVVHSGRWGGYGNCIIIDHGGGLATLYAHCSSLAVAVGEKVKQGQVIGRVGSTGLSTGPHLHFEVRKNGTPVDPMGEL